MAIEAQVTIRGVPAAMHLLNTVPAGIVGPTVEGSLKGLMEEGMTLMSMHITEMVTSDKSRGVLAESIQGIREGEIIQSGDSISGDVKITIGSALPYAGYASREIGWSQIDRNVLLQTGRWVWIGIRPPIPAHPFLEYTLHDLLNSVMPKALVDSFLATSVNIQRDVDSLQSGESAFGAFWMRATRGAT